MYKTWRRISRHVWYWWIFSSLLYGEHTSPVWAVISGISVSGQSQLRVMENRNHDIKNIRGFIFLNRGNDESETVKLMFIDNIQFVRFHKNESKDTQDSRPPSAAPRRDDLRPVGSGAQPLRTGDTLAPIRQGRTPDRVVGGNRPPIQRRWRNINGWNIIIYNKV